MQRKAPTEGSMMFFVIVVFFGFGLLALGEDGMKRLDVAGQANIGMFEISCAVLGGAVLAVAYAWMENNENKIELERDRDLRKSTQRQHSSAQ